MANNPGAKKRIRKSNKRRLENRYYAKTMRNAVRKLRASESSSEAEEMLPKVVSMVDRVAKRGQIHANKAGNIKKQISKKGSFIEVILLFAISSRFPTALTV